MAVAVRTIGHEFLLTIGDSSTRILPIEGAGNTYRLKFEQAIEFLPGQLTSSIDTTMIKLQLSEHYLVEVTRCGDTSVVYGFGKTENLSSELVPCVMRSMDKDCYEIQITLLDFTANEASVNKNLILASIILLLAIVFIIFKERQSPKLDPKLARLGNYDFNAHESFLLFDEERIELTSKECELLNLLFQHKNSTVKKETIFKQVWDDNGHYNGRTLDVFVSKLRKKLEKDPTIKLVNVKGVGYKMIIT